MRVEAAWDRNDPNQSVLKHAKFYLLLILRQV